MMYLSSSRSLLSIVIYMLLFLSYSSQVQSQNFSQNTVNFNGNVSLSSATSLMFGPDGRLYVTEYPGTIKIFSIERQANGEYLVTASEVLNDLQFIQDYNDDGSIHSSTSRETIGLTVVGTATNPVIYVSSSDFRIGGGGGGGNGDVGLDTNSGIITRFSWNGSTWDVVDIVRGLPRSEENHATNGIEFVTVNGMDYLIVSQGGHTNGGAPSTNFAYTAEYALSAAVLSVNLTMLESMPVLDDNGRKYIYDLPTLDDPTRPNINGIIDPDDPTYDGIDVNDPFGGNDGLNQAMIVPGGPVQIFSPGYRNTYDLVVTETGAVFVTDNGANGGWGGFPVNEGTAEANNDYDPNEPGSSSATEDGEKINNLDHLTLVTLDIQNYTFGSFYGGHPNPTRGNPGGAGLYTNPSVSGTDGAIFRTLVYDPDGSRLNSTTDPNIGLPANWPPINISNPQEGDWRGPNLTNPDGPDDFLVTTWGTNTNAIDEYTASNFEGAMKGNLIAGVNTGELRRVELNADGSLLNLTASFASGLGGNALGVTCNSDSDPFPGTIWVGTLSGGLIVLEPQDFVICVQPGDSGYNPLADNDGDGYTNQDEEDNGTDPCNGGSQPNDFDKAAGGTLISDLNDTDDDNDGLLDSEDRFQLGDPLKTGTDAFSIPVFNELFSDNTELKGYLGLGMTGLMNNGDSNPNWLNWLDRRDDPSDPNPNDILGGAIGAMTMQMTSGTALGVNNTQEKGFQYGIVVDQTTGIFTVEGGIVNFDAPLQLYGNTSAPDGELGFFIGDGSQSNYIKFVASQTGLTAIQEINDSPQTPLHLAIPVADRPNSGITFFFVVDPSSGNIQLEYKFDSGSRILLGTIQAEGALLNALQSIGSDLAVGFIGTSNAAGVEVEGTWDYLNVTGTQPFVTSLIPDIEATVGSSGAEKNLDNHFDDDAGVENLKYTVINNTDPSVAASITANVLTLTYPAYPAVSDITIRATDADGGYADLTFKVTISEESVVLYRVNAGGALIASIDDQMDWKEDTQSVNSAYLLEPGSNKTYTSEKTGYTSDVNQSTTPLAIFTTERWDDSSLPEMQYSFPVSEPGNYEVRLYMGNGYSGTSEPGQRVFDVSIEGIIHPELDNVDLSALFGHQIGGVISKMVEVTDGAINITFIHQVENPLINGIEILGVNNAGNPIHVAQMEDQFNVTGDVLDGSLVVSASGGDGNLNYTMTGAPAGVSIEPTNGQIGGTIDPSADTNSPYAVTVVVDDEDGYSEDAVSTGFNWYVSKGEPVVVKDIPDILRSIGASDEVLDLNLYFDDNEGVENLIYTIAANTNPSVGATISGNLLTISFPSEAAVSDITVRATDLQNNYAEQTFMVTVQETSSVLLYRVNTGGALIAAIDDQMDWDEDTKSVNSVYLLEPGSNETYTSEKTGYTSDVDQTTTPLGIFTTERFNSYAAPDMEYSFPVSQTGYYEVRLYMGDGYSGTSAPGQRVFDVSIEGIVHPELDDVDLAALFGHQIGGVISKVVEVTDGAINVSFIKGIQNPLINGIEIFGSSVPDSSIQIAQIDDQYNVEGDILDGGLVVSASGGDGSLVYSMSGAPSGVTIDSATGVISGTIGIGTASGSPYTVEVSVDDSDEDTQDIATQSFLWTVTTPGAYTWISKDEDETYTARHECSFVQAGDKFYLMGGRESATTLDIYDYSSNSWTSLIHSAPFEFNHYQAVEYQGLIWVIGAFKDNNFPAEIPAEYVWAFDPAKQEWIRGPQIPIERQRGSAGLALYNGKFYVVGGNTIGHDGGYVPWFDEYDPSTGTWTPLSDAPRARDHFQAAVVGNKLYAIGGRLSGGAEGTFKPVIPEVDVYDFTTSTWSTLPSDQNIPTPRAAASVVNFKDKLIIIGGEVAGEMVYGELIDDALKITEEYDPVTQNWTRLADLNFERHGTQAIVSGEGIFTTAGSPVRGGGSQKNMEYMGQDSPVGDPSISSSLSVPSVVEIVEGGTGEVVLQVINGNVGLIVTSIEITGTNATQFTVQSGDLTNGLIHAGSNHSLQVKHSGLAGETANLVINYGASGQSIVSLNSVQDSTGETPIQVTQIEDQTNAEGDVLDGSFAVAASGGDGALVYSMSDAPPGVTIDSATGVISGTIAADAALGSPYTVVVTVDDSDTDSADAVQTSFTWTIITGDPFVTADIADRQRTVNAPDEILDLSLYFDDNDGVQNLVFSVTGNTEPSISAAVSGSSLILSFPSAPAVSDITVRATDAKANYVEQTFTVNVIYEGAAIVVEAIPDQNNAEGDVLDDSFAVSASGGDGALVYSMSGAPPGVMIDSATGVISGTIAAEAAVDSPYAVTVTVDDSDSESTDAVQSGFTWTIITGDPVVIAEIPDIERSVNAADEILDLTLHFDDNDGVQNLMFTVTGSTDPSVGTQVFGSELTLSFPSEPSVSDITIRASDRKDNFVEDTFRVSVTSQSGPVVLYRVNAGGPAISAIDGKINWDADTAEGNSMYLSEPGTNTTSSYSITGYSASVDQSTTPLIVFDSQRTDKQKGAPDLTYSFPLSQSGNYEVRLYFGNGWDGGSKPGQQIFDVKLDGVVYPEFNDIDVTAKFGHLTGGMISRKLSVTDGALDINFIHSSKKMPIINAIEILSAPDEVIATSYKSVELTATISEASEPEVNLYPNPASTEVYLKLSDLSLAVERLELFDYNGNLVRVYDPAFSEEEKGLFRLGINGLPDGVYFVLLTTGTGYSHSERLIIKN